MFCKNCGTQLADDTLFCPECGERIDVADQQPEAEETTVMDEKASEEGVADSTERAEDVSGAPAEEVSETPAGNVKYCHNCGTPNAENVEFCSNCGNPFHAGANVNAEQPKRRSAFKPIYFIAGIGAAALLVVAGFAFGMLGGGSKDQPLLYLKDNEVNSLLKQDQTYVVGEDIYSDKDDTGGRYDSVANQVQLTEDNKYIFYPKKKTYENGSWTFTLYYREYGKEKAEEVKVDSDVTFYYAVDKDHIFYIKDPKTKKLYLYSVNTDKEEKIATDVTWFRISEDHKYILWETYDKDEKLYVQDVAMKNNEEKLDNDISYVVAVSDDFQKIVYRKDDVLYVMRNLTEKEKIADSVAHEYVYFQENGAMEIYYAADKDGKKGKKDKESFDLSIFINDDYAAEDANITEPNEDDYTTVEYVPSFWGVREEYVTDWNAYNAARDKYNEKMERDYVREELGWYLQNGISSTFSGSYEAYYYSDAGETTDPQRIVEDGIINYLTAGSVMMYYILDKENTEPVKLSTLMNSMNSEADIEAMVQDVLLPALKIQMFYQGNMTELDLDFEDFFDEYDGGLTRIAVNEKMKECYLFLEKVTEDGDWVYDLYKTGLQSDGSLELVTEECGSIELITDEGIYYTTDVDDNGAGDLYYNTEKIDSDVDTYSCRKLEKGGILYITDPDDDGAGTLYKYVKEEPEKISDDVADYIERKDGSIIFLKDYNFSKDRGDLKIYNKGKVNDVDSDVSCIIREKTQMAMTPVPTPAAEAEPYEEPAAEAPAGY